MRWCGASGGRMSEPSAKAPLAVVVGLDIATRTGWCRWDGERFRTGVIDCSPATADEPEGVRFLKLAERLPSVLEGVQAVVIERTYSKGKRTAEVLNGLTAVALVACETLGVDYAFVDATALKAFAIGGRASKAEMPLPSESFGSTDSRTTRLTRTGWYGSASLTW